MKPLACDFYQLYNIPHSFKIANHSDTELVIKVARKIKSDKGEEVSLTSEQIKNSFWHEVFHAFNFYWNNETDEALAQTFANFMREFELTKQ